ncbi:hypothetical protein [Planctomyces sp. SH-PL62]|uniref:hypothetical protein n=1 Tax=Planctomyces sp. SH-PL62 TaxID=1636152 RepID=UPI00078B6676|nr:hypothetical protein [Planctomyces sp. SH-PL62]AMV40836.1 hypothetical protein VT85_25610 [Planctomyces sp. SH-PL62]
MSGSRRRGPSGRRRRPKPRQILDRTVRLPLPDVASRPGFSHAESLSVAFRRAVGSTSGAYRRENRKPAAPRVEIAPAPPPPPADPR